MMARKTALPVGCEQAQRVPALVPPGIRHLAAFDQNVIDRAIGQKPARRQTGVSGADDDSGDALDGGCLALRPARVRQATSTLTFTGLVMMS